MDAGSIPLLTQQLSFFFSAYLYLRSPVLKGRSEPISINALHLLVTQLVSDTERFDPIKSGDSMSLLHNKTHNTHDSCKTISFYIEGS